MGSGQKRARGQKYVAWPDRLGVGSGSYPNEEQFPRRSQRSSLICESIVRIFPANEMHPLHPFFISLAVFAARTLAWPDYLILAGYFGCSLLIGFCCRRSRRSTDAYFRANNRIVWWAAGISFYTTGASSISFMAIPATTYAGDWLVYGSAIAGIAANLIVALVFVSLLWRLNITTIFEYLDQRFGRSVRILGAVLTLLLKIFARMSVVMLLPALALSTVTGLNVYLSILLMGGVTILYSMIGGFAAVIWTDVMQFIVTFVGVGVALAYISHGVPGGLAGVLRTGASYGKFRMVDWSLNFSRPTVVVFAGMTIASAFTQLADQPLMQRAFATPDASAARKGVIFCALLAIPCSALFFFTGSALFAFYHFHPGRLAATLPNDTIFPFFIVNEIPPALVGLVIAGLFAAAMGTLGSAMNSTAAIVVRDLYMPFGRGQSDREYVKVARQATILAGAAATVMAAYIAGLRVASLWDQFLRLIALIGGGFPGVVALGLLTRRANTPGVITGAVASIAVTWWVQTYTTTDVFFQGFVAIGSCMAIGYAASLPFGLRRWNEGENALTVWDVNRKEEPAVSLPETG